MHQHPGLTDRTPINHSDGTSVDDAREQLECDRFYLKNHSFALDLMILLRTA